MFGCHFVGAWARSCMNVCMFAVCVFPLHVCVGACVCDMFVGFAVTVRSQVCACVCLPLCESARARVFGMWMRACVICLFGVTVLVRCVHVRVRV